MVREFEKEESQGILTGCPNLKVLMIPVVPIAKPITHEKLSEVREMSGKMKFEKKWPP